MFPISSDGVFEDPSIFCQDDKFLEDLLVDFPAMEEYALIDDNGTKKRARKQKASPFEVQENNNNNNDDGSSDSKRIAHRVIEKQRRQEMSALYASLRSLLPLDYIKGKRAVSDHMHQATNYIKDMRKKIEEMKMKRESLIMKQTNVGSSSCNEAKNRASYECNTTHCVKINLFENGIEILISSSLSKKVFPLLKVLEYLNGRNLNVINCISNRGDRCSLHKIHVELNGSTSIDLSELQDGLVNLIECV